MAVVEALSVPEDLDVAEDRSSDDVNVEYLEKNGDDQLALESSPDHAQERADLAIVPVPVKKVLISIYWSGLPRSRHQKMNELTLKARKD